MPLLQKLKPQITPIRADKKTSRAKMPIRIYSGIASAAMLMRMLEMHRFCKKMPELHTQNNLRESA